MEEDIFGYSIDCDVSNQNRIIIVINSDMRFNFLIEEELFETSGCNFVS